MRSAQVMMHSLEADALADQVIEVDPRSPEAEQAKAAIEQLKK